jgi:hypothetical protein
MVHTVAAFISSALQGSIASAFKFEVFESETEKPLRVEAAAFLLENRTI